MKRSGSVGVTKGESNQCNEEGKVKKTVLMFDWYSKLYQISVLSLSL